jgi:hypothetical protein
MMTFSVYIYIYIERERERVYGISILHIPAATMGLRRTPLQRIRVGRFGLVTTFQQSVTIVTVPHLQLNVF